MEYLMRNSAPISNSDWERIDNLVVEVAKRRLVGRRFIDVFGPLGAGIQTVSRECFESREPAAVNAVGDTESALLIKRDFLTIPMIYKDFHIHWRDIEASRQTVIPLDVNAAAGAGSLVAQKEDDLIFNGDSEHGYAGLLNVKGRNILERSDWKVAGNAFNDAVRATEKLTEQGFYPPYAMAASPVLYTMMHRLYDGTGMLEIDQIRKLITGGVYQSPSIPQELGVIVSMGAYNLDLAVAQDIITSYTGSLNMNHMFRVFESVVLRIKSPAAICSLE